MLIASHYQDGLIHGLQLALDTKDAGSFSDRHKLYHQILAYDKQITDYRSKRSYLDVAYFTGYQNALISFYTHSESNESRCPHGFTMENWVKWTKRITTKIFRN